MGFDLRDVCVCYIVFFLFMFLYVLLLWVCLLCLVLLFLWVDALGLLGLVVYACLECSIDGWVCRLSFPAGWFILFVCGSVILFGVLLCCVFFVLRF